MLTMFDVPVKYFVRISQVAFNRIISGWNDCCKKGETGWETF